MAIDVVMTITSDGDTAQAIQESPAHIGIESSHEWPFESRPHFLDYPFTNESATFEDHLAAAERHRPHITTAPDVEKGRELTDVVSMGDKLLDYSDNVIIVPKTCRKAGTAGCSTGIITITTWSSSPSSTTTSNG